MTDSALEAALFAAVGTKQGHRRRVEPDWAEIHRELKRKHVTLWDEYIKRCPEGYRYSRFCELYRSWASRLSVTMRQSHIGGDKLFVDYAGDTVPVIVDRLTGQVRRFDDIDYSRQTAPRISNSLEAKRNRPSSRAAGWCTYHIVQRRRGAGFSLGPRPRHEFPF